MVIEIKDKIIKTKWIFNATSSFKKHYQNERRFNGVYSRDNLPKRSSNEIKDGAYVTNFDEYSDTGTRWIALYAGRANDVTYFDSFGVKNISEEMRRFINCPSSSALHNKNNNKYFQNTIM